MVKLVAKWVHIRLAKKGRKILRLSPREARYVWSQLSPVDHGISRGVTDLCPSRRYTNTLTRAIEASHATYKAEF